jgi:rhamnogalacturonyl hydrolase YesR
MGHVENCFAHIHALSQKAYHGNGVWADRDPKRLARLPKTSRPLNVIDPKFPPLYRNTAWRVIGYARAYRATKGKVFLEKIRAGGEYLLRQQQPNGSFPYWRGREDGWPDTPHLLFCTSSPGCAFLELYRITGDKKYLEAERKAAEWLMSAEISPNNNYNSFAVWNLCELYRETKDNRLLENAVERTVKGVYPQQLPNGAWAGHNSWIFYHSIILRGFAELYGVLPESHPERRELRRRMIMAINHMIVEQRANGFLRSCFDEEEWKKSRVPGNAYSVHPEAKVCPFAIHALVRVLERTDLDVRNTLFGLLSAPPQDELVQGQEGMMLLAYGVGFGWRLADSK